MDVSVPSFSRRSRRQQPAAKRRGGGTRKGVKVVYISSPFKVETSASRFRSLVQELTGRNSDVSRLMEAAANDSSDSSSQVLINNDGGHLSVAEEVDDPRRRESPTSSDSLFEPFDRRILGSPVDDYGFSGMFSSSYFME